MSVTAIRDWTGWMCWERERGSPAAGNLGTSRSAEICPNLSQSWPLTDRTCTTGSIHWTLARADHSLTLTANKPQRPLAACWGLALPVHSHWGQFFSFLFFSRLHRPSGPPQDRGFLPLPGYSRLSPAFPSIQVGSIPSHPSTPNSCHCQTCHGHFHFSPSLLFRFVRSRCVDPEQTGLHWMPAAPPSQHACAARMTAQPSTQPAANAIVRRRHSRVGRACPAPGKVRLVSVG